MNTLQITRFVLKPAVFLACLLPALVVIYYAVADVGALGANPVEEILDRFGNWTLRFILIALAVTPIRRITGWSWLSLFRRMLGLFAFFYALMHFLTWYVLDQGMLMSAIFEDIVKRPFITIGFAALLLLLALAITSFKAIRRRMGRRWQQLHNAVYVIGILGVWHYWWQVKKDVTEPLIYAAILSTLLGARIIWRLARRRKRRLTADSAQLRS